MKKRYWSFMLLLGLLFVSCDQDDTDNDMEEALQQLPRIAILGTDLTDGTFPHLKTWDSTYETAQTDFLPNLLDYTVGQLKNIEGSVIGIEAIFPISEFITYDIENEVINKISGFFTPENELGNFFVLNTNDKIPTFYLDESSTCCNVFLHSYDINTMSDVEFFLGNLDVSPVQFNTFAKNNKTFLTGIDTFTNTKKLFVHNLESNLSLGTLDISDYEGYLYNDALEQVYLFDFSEEALSYDILELDFFSVSQSDTFPQGVTVQSNFNEARFENGKMIFKQVNTPQSSVPLDAIYDFATNSLLSYEGTDLFNIISEQTGFQISILDTEVDLTNNRYVVSGTFQEDDATKGVIVFMTLEREVILSVPSDTIRPDEIILLN